MDIMGFPGASVTPIEKIPLVTNLAFIPLARSLGSVPGILIDQVQFGVFKIIWQVSCNIATSLLQSWLISRAKQYEYLAYLIQVSVSAHS